MNRLCIWFLALAILPPRLSAEDDGATTVETSAPTPVSFDAPSYKRRPFQVSIYIREEYDTNINTAEFDKVESLKTVAEPEIAFNLPDDRTFLGARYRQSTTYYDNRPGDHFDYGHFLDLSMNHEFNSRFSVDFTENFQYTQEPELTDTTGSIFRRQGNFIHNSVHAGTSYYLTRRMFWTVNAGHDYWNYEDETEAFDLNRQVFDIGTGLNYVVSPRTLTSLNYDFVMTRFQSSPRDADSHMFYAGILQTMTPQWTINAQAGGQYRKAESSTADVSPFVQFLNTWYFLPTSAFKIGYNISLQDTDEQNFNYTQSQHAFAEITSQLTYDLKMTGGIDYILNDYPGAQRLDGSSQDASENTLVYRVSMSYMFTPQVYGEAAWSYTTVDSDFFGRSYDRSLASMGVRVVY